MAISFHPKRISKKYPTLRPQEEHLEHLGSEILKRNLSAKNHGYTLVNQRGNRKWTLWRCIPYWNWGFSIAMLIYRRVSSNGIHSHLRWYCWKDPYSIHVWQWHAFLECLIFMGSILGGGLNLLYHIFHSHLGKWSNLTKCNWVETAN